MQPCWHRPGRLTRSGAVTCRHCAVAVEECPCVDETHRKVNSQCEACFGGGWVAIVKGWRTKLRELVA